MRKSTAVALTIAMLHLSGCYTLRHTIGNGGGPAQVATARQWYLAWGLLPLNAVDGGRLSGGSPNCTIQSQMTVVDFVITILLLPGVPGIITSRTVTVYK